MRLIQRLNESTHGPLTVLTAPAGFGKTSLLVEWTRQSPLAIAWLGVRRLSVGLVGLSVLVNAWGVYWGIASGW